MKRIIYLFTIAAVMCLSFGGCAEQTETAARIDITGAQPETQGMPVLEDVVIKYNDDYDSGEARVRWGASLFSGDVYEYNNEIAKVSAAVMAAASEGSNDVGQARYLVPALSGALCFEDISLFSYNNYTGGDDSVTIEDFGKGTDDFAFAIAHQSMQDENGEFELVLIVCRGTVTAGESIFTDFLGTLTTFFIDSWCGHKTYDSFASYANKVLGGLAIYQKEHGVVFSGDVRYLVTGHSLGGAAAQLVAAELTRGGEVVYAYTFGSLNAIVDDATQSCKNVWNIFNYYDDFGPNGNGDVQFGYRPAEGDRTVYHKFGNVLVFDRNYEDIFSCDKNYKNHVMPGYYHAVSDGIVDTDAVYEGMGKGEYVSREPVDVSEMQFQLVGSWIQTYRNGDWEYHNGRVVSFTGEGTCNLWSPSDAYYITDYSGKGFLLNITGAIGGTPQYTVKIIDEDCMEIYFGQTLTFALERYPEQGQDDDGFSILGDWTQTYGRDSWVYYNGRIVTFTSDGHCALWSPYDSYSISAADDGQFILSITGVLGGNPQYTVKMIDNDTIELYLGGEVEFKLSRGGGGW